jgi:hypothetical protein
MNNERRDKRDAEKNEEPKAPGEFRNQNREAEKKKKFQQPSPFGRAFFKMAKHNTAYCEKACHD